MAHGHTHEPIPREALERQHEQRDLSIRSLTLGLVILVVVLALSMAAMAGLASWMWSRASAGDAAPLPVGAADKMPPQPRLEITPSMILDQLRGSETYLLQGYSWVDRDAGAARIPLARAMDIIAEHGLPDWTAVDGAGQQ